MATNNTTKLTGTVEQTSDSGVKLTSGQWFNYSKYGYKGPTGGMPAPPVGALVEFELRNDKFIHTMTLIGQGQGVTPQVVAQPVQNGPVSVPAPQSTPLPTQATPSVAVTNNVPYLIQTTIETRLKILATMAVAKPDLFDLDKIETLTETARNLEQFVLEDLLSSQPQDEDIDITADDLLDEDGPI